MGMIKTSSGAVVVAGASAERLTNLMHTCRKRAEAKPEESSAGNPTGDFRIIAQAMSLFESMGPGNALHGLLGGGDYAPLPSSSYPDRPADSTLANQKDSP